MSARRPAAGITKLTGTTQDDVVGRRTMEGEDAGTERVEGADRSVRTVVSTA